MTVNSGSEKLKAGQGRAGQGRAVQSSADPLPLVARYPQLTRLAF